MNIRTVSGDLLDQECDAIVNAWNRNIIPWWMLWPHGVSGAIKRRAGLAPFKELGHHGPMLLGSSVATSAGKLPHKAIIHVAGINGWWRASEASISGSVQSAMALADELGLASIAFPIIGSGAGSFSKEKAEAIMNEALSKISADIEVTIVRFQKEKL